MKIFSVRTALREWATTCQHMRTCCVTWWQSHPVPPWAERCRPSGAVVGLRNPAWFTLICLFAEAPAELRQSRGACRLWAAPLSPPLFLLLPVPLVSQPCPLSCSPSGTDALSETLWPRWTGRLLPVCRSQSHSSAAPLPLRALPMCKWFVQVLSAALHRPPSSCCLSLHNVWLNRSRWL